MDKEGTVSSASGPGGPFPRPSITEADSGVEKGLYLRYHNLDLLESQQSLSSSMFVYKI